MAVMPLIFHEHPDELLAAVAEAHGAAAIEMFRGPHEPIEDYLEAHFAGVCARLAWRFAIASVQVREALDPYGARRRPLLPRRANTT